VIVDFLRRYLPLFCFCAGVHEVSAFDTARIGYAHSAPGVSTSEVTISAIKVVPYGLQLVLLRKRYSQAQGCVCTALYLSGDVEQSCADMASSIKPEVGITSVGSPWLCSQVLALGLVNRCICLAHDAQSERLVGVV